MPGADRRGIGGRVDRLREVLEEEDLSAVVIFGPHNIRYLTGFSGTSGLAVVTGDRLVLISDFRYRLRAAQEAPQAEFVQTNDRLTAALPPLLSGLSDPIGIEQTYLTVEEWRRTEPLLDGMERRLVGGLVERLREVKGEKEIASIREASKLAAGAFDRLVEGRVVGRTEREVAFDLEMWVRGQGSEPVPFPFIVAAGTRGASPHAEASARSIEPDCLLVVDLGAVVDGYASDMTRTFATGSLTDGETGIYELVARAQSAACAAARPGMACAELDGVARGIIGQERMAELFGHSLGHGVGLEVHEAPRVSAKSEDVLQAGMTFTIEPGVYKEGVGGVRIEDTVVLTESGAQVLTEWTRELVRVR